MSEKKDIKDETLADNLIQLAAAKANRVKWAAREDELKELVRPFLDLETDFTYQGVPIVNHGTPGRTFKTPKAKNYVPPERWIECVSEEHFDPEKTEKVLLSEYGEEVGEILFAKCFDPKNAPITPK